MDVQVGEFYLMYEAEKVHAKRNNWIRKVVAIKEEPSRTYRGHSPFVSIGVQSVVSFREYLGENAASVRQGRITAEGLKNWGELIIPELAYFLIPQIEKLNTAEDIANLKKGLECR